ncbi:MAG: MotA/TolQ/ExbB proton channel family protein [Gammaproteobacteria bacterium]|nr:MotA/TolQ/ExbB proton channel family protein [Pseudomonadota bacterium]MCH9663553.1 MotA/TolQ/ExbB proton channel family protein [Gammaproteobacteria bacterium]
MMTYVYYWFPFLQSVRDFVELGGPVMYLISGLMVIMWVLLFERFYFHRYKFPRLAGDVKRSWDETSKRFNSSLWHLRHFKAYLVSMVSSQLENRLLLISTCIAICPLLGLMGTVTGMIEVFESLAITGSSNPRLMAAGISKATIPTMAGMVAALSGISGEGWLKGSLRRKKREISEQIVIHGH